MGKFDSDYRVTKFTYTDEDGDKIEIYRSSTSRGSDCLTVNMDGFVVQINVGDVLKFIGLMREVVDIGD